MLIGREAELAFLVDYYNMPVAHRGATFLCHLPRGADLMYGKWDIYCDIYSIGNNPINYFAMMKMRGKQQ